MTVSAAAVTVIDMDTLKQVKQAAARVAAGNARVALAEGGLVTAMKAASKDGKSLRMIAEAAGLSHEHVRRTLKGLR